MVRVENAVGTETEISGLRGRMEQSNEAAQAGKFHALAACQHAGMPVCRLYMAAHMRLNVA
jgi:hypothetical protein